MVIDQAPALTFNDVLLAPGKTVFTPTDIDTRTTLGPGLSLSVPIISSPMDTVTEAPMAAAIAQAGGLGIIHRYLVPAEQAKAVAKVSQQGLVVGAAIGTRSDDQDRAARVVKAGASLLVIDTAHGYTQFTLDMLGYLKEHHDVHIMVGNIATAEAASELIAAGADSLRVGMGPGTICTTRLVSGVGMPQLTAIMQVAEVAQAKHIPIIADGGIERSGDIAKALAAGASAVMLGRMLAGTKQAAGATVNLGREEVALRWPELLVPGVKQYQFKRYRGMGSLEAIERGQQAQKSGKNGADYHEQAFDKRVIVAEGVSGLVPLSTNLAEHLGSIMQGVRQGFYYTGNRTLAELWHNARFVVMTPASQQESGAHGVLLGS